MRTAGRIQLPRQKAEAENEIIAKFKDSKNVPVNVPVNVPLKDRQKKVIAALSKDPHASAQKLAEKFGVTEKTIKRNLQLLKQQNLITRVGADKNGYWKVN